MSDKLYLLNISVSGIKCIKEDVRLDFYKKTVDKNFDPKRYRVKAIYGENGAGKSALVTAVKIFQDLIWNDHYLSELKTQEFLDEIINKTLNVFRFKMEFLIDLDDEKLVYQYMLQLGRGKNRLYEIQNESLKMKNGNYVNNKYQSVFECQDGELISVNCTEKQAEWIKRKTINLLSAQSFISIYSLVSAENPFISEKVDTELYYSMIVYYALAVTLKVYLGEEDQHAMYFLQKRLQENRLEKQELIETLLGQCNRVNLTLDVNEKFVEKKNIDEYKARVKQLTRFIKLFKPNLVSIDVDAKEDGERYVCDLNLNYGDYVINKEFESTGIKKLIRLFDCFAVASGGGIVFVDEMDANLNDVYLCKLIEYFMYYGKGQLCFTTHNLGPMSALKENKNSIDFLSSDNHLIPWTSRGNATPENCYRNGMIEDLPFNVEASDFVGIFGE